MMSYNKDDNYVGDVNDDYDFIERVREGEETSTGERAGAGREG